MPTGDNLPSLLSAPAARYRLEMRRMKQRLLDLREYAPPLHPLRLSLNRLAV